MTAATSAYCAALSGIEIPDRVRSLPIDERGFPIPWFVGWFDPLGRPCRRGSGKPDFRVIGMGNTRDAISGRRCWICGTRLGAHVAFVVGPMCVVNRISSEPPAHRGCALFAVKACPFLTKPRMRRNEAGIPAHVPGPGHMLLHNPGASAVYITRGYRVVPWQEGDSATGVLLRMDQPEEVLWYTEGRTATRAEVKAAFDLGLPKLRECAVLDQVVEETEREIERSYKLWPKEEGARP